LSGRIAIVVNTAATQKSSRDAQEAIVNKEPIIVGMVVILMIIRRSHSRWIIAIGLRPGAAGNAKQEGQGE